MEKKELISLLSSDKVDRKEISFKDNSDAFVVKDVTLLSAGVWADSVTKTPVLYSPETLKNYYNNWSNTDLNINHSHGLLERIGKIENIRFVLNKIIGDLVIYPITQTARDVIALLKSKVFKVGVSVEMKTVDLYNVDLHVLEAAVLEFVGAALVTNPACKDAYIW